MLHCKRLFRSKTDGWRNIFIQTSVAFLHNDLWENSGPAEDKKDVLNLSCSHGTTTPSVREQCTHKLSQYSPEIHDIIYAQIHKYMQHLVLSYIITACLCASSASVHQGNTCYMNASIQCPALGFELQGTQTLQNPLVQE